ncbi:MAG: hypothetical protein ACM3JB_18455 [Acidobacteriaceae bacterium]
MRQSIAVISLSLLLVSSDFAQPSFSVLERTDAGMSAVLLLFSTMFLGGGLLIWVWCQVTPAMLRWLPLYMFTLAVVIAWGIAITSWMYDSHWAGRIFQLVLLSLCLSYVLVLVTALASPRGALRTASRALLVINSLFAAEIVIRAIGVYFGGVPS